MKMIQPAALPENKITGGNEMKKYDFKSHYDKGLDALQT